METRKLTLEDYHHIEDTFWNNIQVKMARGHSTQEAATRQELGNCLENLGLIKFGNYRVWIDPKGEIKVTTLD